MKNSFFQIALYCLLLLCTSCKGYSVEPDMDEMQESRLSLIKLSSEMQKQVFVSRIVDSVVVDYTKNTSHTLFYGEGLVLCNPTSQDSVLVEFAQTQWNLAGKSPYVLLENGYVIIDWKWAHFQPLSGAFRIAVCNNSQSYSTNYWVNNGSLINEEYYLLSIGWQEVVNLNGIWNMDIGIRIDNPEIRYIKQSDLEKYGNLSINYKDINHRYTTDMNHLLYFYNLYKRDTQQFGACVDEYNQLQSLYVTTLNQMIKNGDFEKWTQIKQ